MIYLGPDLKTLPCKHPKSISMAEVYIYVWKSCCVVGMLWNWGWVGGYTEGRCKVSQLLRIKEFPCSCHIVFRLYIQHLHHTPSPNFDFDFLLCVELCQCVLLYLWVTLMKLQLLSTESNFLLTHFVLKYCERTVC